MNTIKNSNSMQLGEELSFLTSTRFAGRGYIQTPRTYNVIAGSYLVVNAYAGSVSPHILQQAQTKLENTKATLETADQAQIGALTRQELLGDMFHAGGLGYYAQLTALSHIMGLQAKGQHTLAAGTGTFGYEPNVDYFFGFPRAITTGGVAFDIPFLNIVASNDGDTNKKRQFNQQVGILSSALEHAVPEQMFVNEQNPGEAISAVKALQKASAQGQRIYQITQANQASTLPNIHHAQATMDEIRHALNAGKEITTHTDAVQVPGWSGAGYIITDPTTGDGAYKISGGGNGGYLEPNELEKGLFWSAVEEFSGPLNKALVKFKTIYDHIVNIIELIEFCSTNTAILAIISITLVLVGFALLTPFFASFASVLIMRLALVGYGVFSGLGIMAVKNGWLNSCKKQ